jgi:hypothetical protein
VQHLDDYEDPPSLVTSSGYSTNGYQFPYYPEGVDQHGSAFHQSRVSTPQYQPQSPPLSPSSLPPLPMTIPVLSSVYPHPAQNAAHPHDEPLSHTAHSVPLPTVPLHSPMSSSPFAASPSPASSVHLQASQRERKKKLKKDDIVYWHNLQKSGEIPGVEEDQRARGGNSGGGGVSKGTEATSELSSIDLKHQTCQWSMLLFLKPWAYLFDRTKNGEYKFPMFSTAPLDLTSRVLLITSSRSTEYGPPTMGTATYHFQGT